MEQVAGLLGKPHRKADESLFICPRHDDHNPSLSINLKKGKWLCPVCRKGGISAWGLFAFVQGLSPADKRAVLERMKQLGLIPDLPDGQKSRKVTEFYFRKEDGTVDYRKERWEPGFDGIRKKDFIYRRLENGEWKTGLGDRRPLLYNRPALSKAKSVILVEGEAKVDLLKAWGLTATTSGSCSSWRPEFAELFRGKRVVIIPDNDNAGEKYAMEAGWDISRFAEDVRIVRLPEVGEKGDIIDFKDKGGTPGALIDLIKRTSVATAEEIQSWKPGNRADPGENSQCSVSDASIWPEPEPLLGTLPRVPAFDASLLPPLLQSMVEDISERMQAPPDFAGAAIICTTGAVAGRRAIMLPKQVDDSWKVASNKWGAIIGPPGFMKTPLISAVLAPLYRLEKEMEQKFTAEEADYKRKLEVYQVRKALWRDRVKKDRTGRDFEAFEDEPEKPIRVRFIVNDATVEKLHEILADNPAGVLYTRDELTGWLQTFRKPGRESDRAFYLETWSGDKDYTVDRIGRGTRSSCAVCVSILGGIQPHRLLPYLADAVNGGVFDDGLIQRFQCSVWPDLAKDWQNVDRLPKREVVDRIEVLYRRILEISPDEPRIYRFNSEAQGFFNIWLSELEHRLRRDSLPPCVQGHLAKYRSLMPSLALILELATESQESKVSLRSAKHAAKLCEYFEAHAWRIYSSVVSRPQQAAAGLAEKIKSGVLSGTFTVREVYLKNWVGLNDPEKVREALLVLKEAGWVRREEPVTGPQGGRPSELYRANPRLVVNGS